MIRKSERLKEVAMEKNNNKPKLRFPGFTDPWEQRKFGDITSYIKGFAFKSVDYKVDGIRIIRVSDLSKDCVSEDVDKIYIDKNKAKQYINYTINNGDIVITTVGSKAELKESAVGRPIIFTENKGYLLNQNLVKMEPNPNYGSQFIYNQLLRERYIKYIADIQRGNANQANITISELLEYSFHCPAFAEQKKIGQFFNKLDNTITLHQRKLNHLQYKKKSLLQKMFPKNGEDFPELRFPGFTDPWEQRKLGEISDKVTEKNTENFYDETLTNSAEFGIVTQRDFFDKDISNAKNLNGYYVVHNDDFVYNPRISNFAPVGPIKRNRLARTGVMSPLYYVFRTHDIDKTYLEHYFDTTCWHSFMKLNGDSGARADRFAIKDSVFIEMPIPFPNLEEQKKIGKFFDTITLLITLHQRKLNHLQEQKKALLQQMFV